MRFMSLVLCAVLITACATEPNPVAFGSCPPPGEATWTALAKPPPQAPGLIARMREEAWYKQLRISRIRGSTRWFSAANGSQLAYCYTPLPTGRCEVSDPYVTVTFAWQDGAWQETSNAAEVSVCGS
jgi:hypothetical protein